MKEVLTGVLVIYGTLLILIASFAIGRSLINYTFDINLITGILMLPFSIGMSLFPIIFAWLMKR